MKRPWIALCLLAGACTVPVGGPATLEDSATTFSGEILEVPVLVNDWPDAGLALTGVTVPSGAGAASVVGDVVVYEPGGFAGSADLVYTAEYGGVATSGMLRVDVRSPDIVIELPDTFGDVPVFSRRAIRGSVASRAGRVQVSVEGPPELEIDQSDCTEVGAGERCEFVVAWFPTAVGPHSFDISVNGVVSPVSGSSIHAFVPAGQTTFETVEGTNWIDSVDFANRSDADLVVEVFSSNPDVRVRPCPPVAPGQECAVTLSLVADAMPQGGGIVDGELLVSYGPISPVVELIAPFEITVVELPLFAPTLRFPLQSTVWIGELTAPITFEWEGEPGPEGWLVEVFHCSEACTQLVEATTRNSFLEVPLTQVIDTVLVRIPAGIPIGHLEWRVSALGPGDRRATAVSDPLALRLDPVTVNREIPALDPESGANSENPTLIPNGGAVEIVLQYESHLLADARAEVAFSLNGVSERSAFAEVEIGRSPLQATLSFQTADTLLAWLTTDWIGVYLDHLACGALDCFIWETVAYYQFEGDPID